MSEFEQGDWKKKFSDDGGILAQSAGECDLFFSLPHEIHKVTLTTKVFIFAIKSHALALYGVTSGTLEKSLRIPHQKTGNPIAG